MAPFVLFLLFFGGRLYAQVEEVTTVQFHGDRLALHLTGSPRVHTSDFERGGEHLFTLSLNDAELLGDSRQFTGSETGGTEIDVTQYRTNPDVVHIVVRSGIDVHPTVKTAREGANGYQVALLLKNSPARTIFLDVGHGGYDPGGVGPGGLPESFVNLDVAERLKRILTRSGFRVALDRTTNEYVSLPDRVTMADKSGADLFLGLYCNASSDRSIHGTTTYYFHPGAEAFARELEDLVAGSLHLSNDGVMKDNLYVIRHTTARIPDVLIEYAYISNYHEQSLLGTPAFRQRIAVALGKAITDYFAAPSASAANRPVPSAPDSAPVPVRLPVLPQLPDPLPAQPARISSFRAQNGAVTVDATGPPSIDTFSMNRDGTNYFVANLEDAVLAGARRRIAVGPPFSGTATIDQFSTSPDVVRIAVREQFENSYRVESVPQAGGRVLITVYPIDN